MEMIKLVWNNMSEEGEVKVSTEFKNAYEMLKLDALQDWIAALEEMYHEIMESSDDRVE